MKPIKVSELVLYLDRIVRDDPILKRLRVEGEIVNLSRGRHIFFDLKDDGALVHCVDFNGVLPATAKEGDCILLTAAAMVYKEQGKFELRALSVEEQGQGKLLVALDQLRRKLAAEGLFSPARKRSLPRFPRRIGLITSAEGAVLHDFANEVHRRYPLARILFSPASVQGTAAPEAMCEAFQQLALWHKSSPLDVVVLARGGGSGEDLSAFNDEHLVRCIAACPVPVIAAIGHQVDTTLSDLAADRRASTPTEAAILATPDGNDLLRALDTRQKHLSLRMQQMFDRKGRQLEQVMRAVEKRSPSQRLRQQAESLQKHMLVIDERLRQSMRKRRHAIDERVRRAAAVREKRLAETSWTVKDLNGRPVLAGALRLEDSYYLRSGAYQYRIIVKEKEKKDVL